MRRVLAVLALIGTWPAAARADQCASYGPRALLSTPLDGSIVAANARFHLGLYTQCDGVEGGPRHRFRLLDAAGQTIPADEHRKPTTAICQPSVCEELALVPRAALAPGLVRLEVRRPIDQNTLGPWTTLARVTATERLDQTAPTLAGIDIARAEPIEGSAFLSPCEAIPAWELRTTVEFDAADDAPTDHDELLYALDRQPPAGGPWIEVAGFRPSPVEGRRMRFYFDSDDWTQRWRYRLRVHDAAGNETIGARTAVVTAPAEPTEPVPGSRPERERWRPGSGPEEVNGSGCASCRVEPPACGRAPALGWLGLMALAWRRRRRKAVDGY